MASSASERLCVELSDSFDVCGVASCEILAGLRRSSEGGQHNQLEMWANAQRDGRPAEYRWRPLFNAAKFG